MEDRKRVEGSLLLGRADRGAVPGAVGMDQNQGVRARGMEGEEGVEGTTLSRIEGTAHLRTAIDPFPSVKVAAKIPYVDLRVSIPENRRN